MTALEAIKSVYHFITTDSATLSREVGDKIAEVGKGLLTLAIDSIIFVSAVIVIGSLAVSILNIPFGDRLRSTAFGVLVLFLVIKMAYV